MLVSRGLSARRTPTDERPTSYYRLAGETAPPNSNVSFSPNGIIVNISTVVLNSRDRYENVWLPDTKNHLTAGFSQKNQLLPL